MYYFVISQCEMNLITLTLYIKSHHWKTHPFLTLDAPLKRRYTKAIPTFIHSESSIQPQLSKCAEIDINKESQTESTSKIKVY
ncbi:hypothetical protein Hanom_Chr12g01105491 [Helianthus anomalus]